MHPQDLDDQAAHEQEARAALADQKLAFIGGGVMAEVMISGVLERQLARPEAIIASHPRSRRATELAEKLGIKSTVSNAEAARLAGLRPRWITLAVFVFMGVLTGCAAFLNVVQSPQVDPKSGTGLELKAIAAAVVGGVAVSGGRGNLWGVFVGVLLLACINPALTYLHVEAYWEKAIQGAIILLAVIFDGLRNRKPTS